MQNALTFIKLPFVIKIYVLSIFEWPFYTGFAVYESQSEKTGPRPPYKIV